MYLKSIDVPPRDDDLPDLSRTQLQFIRDGNGITDWLCGAKDKSQTCTHIPIDASKCLVPLVVAGEAKFIQAKLAATRWAWEIHHRIRVV